MENIYNLPTVTLVESINLIKEPATYLLDTFFPNKMPVANTAMVALEFRKGKRALAPYIVNGSKALNIARDESQANFYAAPMLGAVGKV